MPINYFDRLVVKSVCIALFVEFCLVLSGWQFNTPVLQGLVPGAVAVNPLTAICFLGIVVSLWLLLDQRAKFSWLQKACAGFIFIAGLTKLIDCLVGTHLTLDHFLFAEKLNGNQMALNTAVEFCLIGIILLLIGTKRQIKIAQFFDFIVLIIAWIPLLGYMYGSKSLYAIGSFYPMALPTAISFVILSFAIFCVRANEGLAEHVTSDTSSGKIARLLFPACLLAPSVLGWVKIVMDRNTLIDASVATACLTISNIIFFFAVIWFSTKSISHFEKKLKSTQQDLEDFFENASMGLHWVSGEGIILKANRHELNMLGYKPEEYIGHHISQFHVDEEVINNILCYLTEGRTLIDYQARLKCKDGSIKHVLINSNVYWENGKFIHTRCFTRDITAQKEAEESNGRLAAIVESSEDAIISKDLNSIIMSWNKGAQQIFGYTAHEMIGKSITLLIPDDRRNEEFSIVQRIRRGERIEHYETIRQRKDGKLVDISLTISPIKDVQGKIIGASKIARDISDRKRTERELIRSNSELEQFAYIASHDLQEPLHLINSFVGLFVRRCKDKLDDKEKEYLGFIQQGSMQAKTLIKELLEYSSVGKDRVEDTVSLKNVLKEIETNLKLPIEESGAKIHYNGLPDIKGRHSEMVQLFQNLISNAIKYRKEAPQIEISSSRSFDGKSWLFAVKDNGIGIDPEFKDRIFGMFERLHSKEYSGTGIGLAICKKIVEHHGGRIWVDSTPGKGSTFHFIIDAT